MGKEELRKFYILYFSSELTCARVTGVIIVLLTYRLIISLRSCGSSSGVTDRSAMETWDEAVSVTSSTKQPRDSSSDSSRWWVCSLVRVERSNWQLDNKHSEHMGHTVGHSSVIVKVGLTFLNKVKMKHTERRWMNMLDKSEMGEIQIEAQLLHLISVETMHVRYRCPISSLNLTRLILVRILCFCPILKTFEKKYL